MVMGGQRGLSGSVGFHGGQRNRRNKTLTDGFGMKERL